MSKNSGTFRLEMHNQELSAELCARRTGAALQRWAVRMRYAARRIGDMIGTDRRAVENYLYGQHCPPMNKLIELMAECDELCAEVNKMVAERREAKKGKSNVRV